jgi:hypothetical protein
MRIVFVCGEEVVVEGTKARELKKRSTSVMIEARRGMGARVKRESREERAKRRVTVDERC